MNKKLRNLLLCLFFALIICLMSCGPVLPGGTPAAMTPAASPVAAITLQALSVQAKPTQTPAGGPQIVQQTPMSAERLALQPLIQLVFDRDMDKARTAAAWSFSDAQGKPVTGAISWQDARTFEFKPDAKLEASAAYDGVFSTAAVGADGKSPDAAIKLAFHTVDALIVGQVFPADTAADVEVGANITVIFNRPIVPINIVEEQGTLPQPLKIDPAVAGHGEWLNSSVYIFQPDKVLSSGTQYSLRVPAGLADAAGNTLASDYSWKFSTRAPEIGHFSLLNGEQDPKYEMGLVLLDQAFVVDFLQPMEPASVEKALTLVNRETQAPFPTKPKWNKDFTELTIEPVGRYTLANFYTLTLSAAAQSASGSPLKVGLTFKFSTVPYPAIENVYPAQGSKAAQFDSSMWIQFSSPMNFASMKDKVKITPPLDKEPNLYYDDSQRQLHIDGLAAATDYVVRVLPGMADIYGNTIKTEYSFSFKTGNLSSNAQMLFPYTPLVYRKTGVQEFFFEYTNLKLASFSLYQLSFDQFKAMLSGEGMYAAPNSTPVREWDADLKAISNKVVRDRIKLQDKKGNSLPPGYYFIGLKAPSLVCQTLFCQSALFVVATDNITLKITSSEALAWVVDLEKGQPVANVSVDIYNSKYAQIGTARTDDKGLVYLKGLTDPYIAQLDDPQHVAVASTDWGSGVSPYDFGIWQSYYGGSANNAAFAYVYTERPLYRPGQDVYFKGIVRQNDDLHYSLPTDSQVYVTIELAGEKVYAEHLDLSKLGTFTGTFKLGDNVTLGTYDIFVRYAISDDPFATVSFRVADYHKPEFQVNAATDVANVLVGDPLNFSLDASYYSGGAVGNANVQWFTQAMPYFFQPASKYSGFSFMDWDRDAYWNPPAPNGNGALAEGQGVTDAQGHLDIKQVASLGESTVSQQVSFSANVTDIGGNLVSGSANVVVHQTSVYAGIRSTDYIGTADKDQTFEMVALGWDSSPVANQALSVDFVERQWLSVQQQDAQGQLTWVTSVKEIPVTLNASVVTDKDGLATISFKPLKGGVYKATVTVRDAKGHTQHASAYIWVSSEDYIPWRQTNDRSFNLIADKDSYAPGDTANIMIAQPFQNDVYALVTFERGHIYQKEVVLLKGNSTIYKLPITKDMAPAAYVSVVVVSGAQDGKAPDFKIGMTRINVDTSQQTLDVSVTTDKRAAGPGDEVTYTVQTKDMKGNAVPAEVSLAVVDKAVLALAPSNSGPILASFYSEQGLGVMTSVGIVLNAEDFNANYHESVVDGESAGGGGKGEGDLGIITVRQDFKDTAFFTAQVMTDENGQAQVKVKLPQNLTTWQVDVRAVTADSRVGQTTGELISTKPLFVEMQTPRFFTAGDAARVGAVIHNNGDSSLKVSVSLDAQGVDLKSPAAQTVDVPARQQAYVTWDVVVRQGVRRVDFTASASSGAFTDSSKPALGTLPGQGLPVYSYEVPETVGTSGMISDANSVTETFQLPKTMGFGNTTLSVQVAPSLAASMKDGLTYLQDYSYLCIEQTISRFLPNVVSAHALKLSGAPAITLQSDLDQNVNTALQRLYAKQLGDGGWGWWDAQISDPLTSAYVVLGLQEAKEAGYIISDDVLSRGVDYLNNSLPFTDSANGYAPGTDSTVSLHLGGGGGGKPTPAPEVLGSNDATWKFNRQAFMVYVLARSGQQPSTAFLYQYRNSLSLYGKAYLAQAIYNVDPQDKRIPTLMSDLASAAVLSAAGAHWEEGYTDYWNWNTDVRTTAIVLDTFVKVDPKNPLTANAVRWLMAHRDGGHWASTQETAWTLMALTHWLVASKEYETNYQYAVGLNGNKLKDAVATKDNLTETMKLEIDLKDLLVDQANSLVLTRGAGVGNLYYSAYMTTTLPVEDVKPLDQGVVISRQYFSLDDPKKPITQAARGDLVRVRLTMVIPDSVHYIVVNDPLPAGFEALDAAIATDAQAPSSYTRQDFDLRGWGWWYFTHVEMRDEKVVLSTDYLPAGTYVYTYLARASTAGTFKVIPPNAAEFYFPDVGGRGAGSTFTVK
ncbi:MAG: Ig-like domain-containing protein [Anaerolineales bacterium]